MTRSFDVQTIRKDFPCLHQQVNGYPLVFLDSAASAQKPQCMIDALTQTYTKNYANIHRGLYYLSDLATRQFESVRGQTARFLNAASDTEIVFTKSATEAINLVAHSYVKPRIQPGDEIIISHMEHHANLVPWQQLCLATGAILRVAPITNSGELDMDAYCALLSKRTAFVAMTHMSNALGTITPMAEIIAHAHHVGAKILVDACQSVVHLPIDVQALHADFLVFSAHKLYGPNGVGILYGKYELLESMLPYQTGGEMVDSVTFKTTSFRLPPLRFEAGTPAIAEVIAFGATLDYINRIDLAAARTAEHQLVETAIDEIRKLKGFKIIGTSATRRGLISFIHHNAHPSDIGTVLDHRGIAIRTGHHCAQPVMERFGITGSARASFGIYNTAEDVDLLLAGLHSVNRLFGEN